MTECNQDKEEGQSLLSPGVISLSWVRMLSTRKIPKNENTMHMGNEVAVLMVNV